ncbi:tetratricopeptide repeat protein [Pedobacter sp. SG908]|uniref:tetratricopeptide repeat protein n=1 Tax=Pedobacter sp. SG908 TaxID=2587135 RepID=UPI00141DF42B|nr:tetratricopeptide repeat protein [Pedobacter sp. SG908]NII83790.1 tetratricopeptide (TPR) repeat protein [Pedobacter sp. SG908]
MTKPFSVLILFLLFISNAIAQEEKFESIIALNQKDPTAALAQLKKIYAKSIDDNDELLEGKCLQQMGKVCYTQGHFSQSLEFFLKADKIFNNANQSLLLATNLNDAGVLYYYMKQKDKAMHSYSKAISIYKRSNNLTGQATVLGNIGQLYEKRQLYDSAFYYQKLALKINERVSNKSGAAKIHENLGSIYEDLERYDSAYVHFKQSLNLYQEDHNDLGSIEVINNLGDVLRKTGRYKESIVQTETALKLAEKMGNIYQLSSCCRDLGKAYELLHNMDSAYHYVKLGYKYTIDLYSEDGARQVAFLQVLYDINKKSDEINKLKNDRKVNRIIAFSATIVVILLIVLGFVIFSRQRLKLRDQQMLARQKAIEYDMTSLALKNLQLEEQNLKQLLEVKSRELSTHTLNLIKHNQFLENLRSTLQAMVKEDKRDQKKQMNQILTEINQSFNHERNWKEFTVAFEQVHHQFLESLKKYSNELTSADMRLIALLKMNLDSGDIATLLGISTDSLRVSRYRLRKKLNLVQGDNLSAFIQAL